MKNISTQNSLSLFGGTEFEQLGSRNMQSIILESSYARTNNSLDQIPQTKDKSKKVMNAILQKMDNKPRMIDAVNLIDHSYA